MESMECTLAKEPSTRNKSPDIKVCGVCGDRALGYNFNAITCESCKAFFRRNALRNKDFKCPFEGDCKVDVITRRFCQMCRLKKCFNIGMKKEWIMSDDEKRIKRSKIEENRVKRVGSIDHKTSINRVDPMEIEQHNFIIQQPPQMSIKEHQFHESNEHAMAITAFDEPYDSSKHTFNSFNMFQTDIIVIDQARNNRERQQSSNSTDASMRSDQSDDYNLLEEHSSSLISNKKTEASVLSPSSPVSPLSTSPNVQNISKMKSPSSIESQISPSTSNSQYSYSPAHFSSANVIQTESKSESAMNGEESNSSVTHMNLTGEAPWTPITSKNENCSKISQNVYRQAIELEFAMIPLRKNRLENDDLSLLELNEREMSRLEELIIAGAIHKKPLPEFCAKYTLNNFLDVVKMTDIAIRRLIKMTKNLSCFKSLCDQDQIALLKGGSTEMMMLRSMITFNPYQDSLIIPENHTSVTAINLDIFKKTQFHDVFEAYKKFTLDFDPRWRTDENVLSCLLAIALFTPDRPNLIHTDLIKLEQQTYMYLLQRYLETKYQIACEAKTAFLQLMSRLEDLHTLNEQYVRVYLDVNPKDVGPLLIEIFNLKH